MEPSLPERTESRAAVNYHHVVVEGTAYDAGRLEAAFLKQVGRTVISYEPPEPEKAAAEMRRLLDEHCPGLIDETRGAADFLGIPFEKALFCAALGPAHPGCSQMAILPGATQTGHLYVARSYEIGLSEADLRLCTMRLQGNAAHLGFSEMLVGRNDGINSHGLCVTMSGSWDATPPEASESNGLHYPYVVRSALDHCATLDDALALLERAPISGGVNIILADRSGAAALMEIAGRQRAVKRIGARTDEQFIFATNHSTMLGVSQHSDNSVTRYRAMEGWLQANMGQIDAAALKRFLAREYPEGVCGFSRELQMGTLWSIVFDVTMGIAEIRFGPPPDNPWYTFTLAGPIGEREYVAWFPGL